MSHAVQGSDSPELSPEESAESRRRAYRLLAKTLKPRWKLLLLTGLVSIIASLLEALPPLFLAKGIDEAIPAFLRGDSGPLVLLVSLFVASAVVMGVTYWLSGKLTAILSQSALMEVRERTFRKAQRLPLSFHERHTSGRTIARQTSDMDTLQEFLDGGVTELVGLSLFILFSLVTIFILDPWSLVVVSVFLVLMFFVCRWFLKSAEAAFRENRVQSARLIVKFVETLTGVRAVQAFRTEKRNNEEYSRIAGDYVRTTMNSIGIYGTLQATVVALGNLSMVAVLLVGGLRALEGDLSIGALAAVALATRRIYGPIRGVVMYVASLQSAQAALEKVATLLEEPEGIRDPQHPAQLPVGRGEVSFEAVSFGYVEGSPIMENLNLHIPAGQTVAVVGQTGAGKSTLAKLLSRFYDVTAGSVRLDGVDVRDMRDADLRKRVVMVTQEAYLFSGSVASNIALGQPGASREEIEAAAKAVGAHEFISDLPQGYDTDVSKRGGRVSAGQRQLISFARAFLAAPSVLILDEATSSLDLPSERLVQEGLSTLLQGRTSLIIAHRLSTLSIADRVLVVEDGRVVEDGTPEELIASGGHFADLDAAWKRSLS